MTRNTDMMILVNEAVTTVQVELHDGWVLEYEMLNHCTTTTQFVRHSFSH